MRGRRPLRPRIVQGLAAAATAVLIAGIAVAAPAEAIPRAATWNTYSTTLPEYVTGPTPFEVIVDGPFPVCSMTFGGTTLTTAPWAFTYDPDARPAAYSVDIVQCDGAEDYEYVDAEEPFRVDGRFIYRSDYGKQDTVSVTNRMNVPAVATVTTSQGKVLSTTPLPPGSFEDIRFPMNRGKKTIVYALTLTGENGVTQTEQVVAPKGWTPLLDDVGAAFAPCSALAWSYDRSGAARNSEGMLRDIRGSLKRLSKVTGLTFVQTKNPADADITYGWENMGSGGPAGTGGFTWSSNSESQGGVLFNSRNSWTTDAHAGFAPFRPHREGNTYYTAGPAGRGWLVIHETMHALGLGHVDERDAVMAPINRGQGEFSRGDLEGLRYLYPRAGCAA